MVDKDEIAIKLILKKLGFRVKDQGNDYIVFEKTDSPLLIKITKIFGIKNW